MILRIKVDTIAEEDGKVTEGLEIKISDEAMQDLIQGFIGMGVTKLIGQNPADNGWSQEAFK